MSVFLCFVFFVILQVCGRHQIETYNINDMTFITLHFGQEKNNNRNTTVSEQTNKASETHNTKNRTHVNMSEK